MSFANNRDKDDEEVISEINMIPMIDVMLVLLVIFIITAPIMHHAFKLELPQASNVPQNIMPETIQIAVESDGQYRWNNDYISREELEKRLQSAASTEPQPEIHLNGDKNARYELIINVIRLIKNSSLSKISFVTNPID